MTKASAIWVSFGCVPSSRHDRIRREAQKNLHERNLVEPLNELVINQKKPYLGICLGLEFLANHSFEGGTKTQGFGWIDGEIKKIQTNDKNLKIPHMGWDDTKIIKNNMLLNELESQIWFIKFKNPSTFIWCAKKGIDSALVLNTAARW